jgi:hypothetical protein
LDLLTNTNTLRHPRNWQSYCPPIPRPNECAEIENEVSDWLDQNNLGVT